MVFGSLDVHRFGDLLDRVGDTRGGECCHAFFACGASATWFVAIDHAGPCELPGAVELCAKFDELVVGEVDQWRFNLRYWFEYFGVSGCELPCVEHLFGGAADEFKIVAELDWPGYFVGFELDGEADGGEKYLWLGERLGGGQFVEVFDWCGVEVWTIGLDCGLYVVVFCLQLHVLSAVVSGWSAVTDVYKGDIWGVGLGGDHGGGDEAGQVAGVYDCVYIAGHGYFIGRLGIF